MKVKFSVYLLLLLIPFSVFGQIKISVLDEQLRPISGVVLLSSDPKIEQVSDASGIVELQGNFLKEVLLSHVAYQDEYIQNLSTGTYRFVLKPQVNTLDQVEVQGFGSSTKLNQVAGAIRKFEASELDRFDQQSLVRPLNLTPGIRFEERAGASYRVSIRGSSLRSPFGIRNVKVYWNGIPFTDAGGNTFLNLLDRQNMNGLEVIKGPAGSMFGAGTGGVMKFQSTNYAGLINSVMTHFSAGSFGYLRYGVQANSTTEKASWTAKFVHHESAGYREHNALKKDVLEVNGLLFSSPSRTLETAFIYSDLFYEIPGGLTKDQFDDDPTQARPRSASQNASIDHQMALLKLGQDYRFGNGLSNNTQLFGSIRRFKNPFILDYKQEEETRLGVRSVVEFSKNPEKMSIFAGVEAQVAWLAADNFGNVGGERDTIRFADELTNTDFTTFINAHYFISSTWKLEAGLSYANTVYDIDRTIDRINNTPQSFNKRFDPSLNPRVAVSKLFNDQLSAHFSVSIGYSVPTTLEVRTNEGSINEALQPERGVNYEFNLRGGGAGFSYDLSLFHFDLTESITTFTQQDGVVLFRNAGQLKQQGAELELLKPWFTKEKGLFQQLSSRLALTYHNFEFKNYQSGGDDFSGNALTGTAPWIVGFSTDAKLTAGLFINFSYLYTDAIPLNDENTVFADPYTMVFTKLGWRKAWPNFDAEISFGVDNLLNENYSLGNDLNAFGGRYFQPAPTRSFSVDLIIKRKK